MSCPHFRYALPAYYLIAPSEASSNLARFDAMRYGLRTGDDGTRDAEEVMALTREAGFGAEVKLAVRTGGVEGETDDPHVIERRTTIARSLMATLFVSQGVPMLEMGDELWRTQRGNSNAYCHDSELTWVDWRPSDASRAMLGAARSLISLRKRLGALRQVDFLRGGRMGDGRKDITWLRSDGAEMQLADWKDPALAALAVLPRGRSFGPRAAERRARAHGVPCPGAPRWARLARGLRRPRRVAAGRRRTGRRGSGARSREVETPQTLSAGDLAHLPTTRRAAVLECAGNGNGPYQLASNAEWEGWAVDDVLRLARPRESAQYLHLHGRDGFTRSVPIARARQDALMATRINQQPLPPDHGAPWRALFPGYYGMDSVKWLERITVANSPLEPVSNDYLALQKSPGGAVQRLPLPGIQLKSVFVYPAVGAVLRIGRVNARGLAWSNGEEIMAAEVSADGGKTWRLARIEPPDGKYGWRFWHTPLDLSERGLVELCCKAIDSQGRQQPTERPGDRADGYADNRIERIRVMVI